MSTPTLKSLLKRQQIVDNLIHAQTPSPRQNLLEEIISSQRLAEIEQFVEKNSPRQVAQQLEQLSDEQAHFCWKHMPEAAKNLILWELSTEWANKLSIDTQPNFANADIAIYHLEGGRLKRSHLTDNKGLDGLRPIWIDLVGASKSQRNFIGEYFGVALPDPMESTELEISARFHVLENEDIHLHSNFLVKSKGIAENAPVAFVLSGGTLFSIRDVELPVFRHQRRRVTTQAGYVNDSIDILLDLYGADVEVSADNLEGVYLTLGKISKQVLDNSVTDEDAGDLLAKIAEEEDENGRIRSNILDTQRALNFLKRSRKLSKNQIDDVDQISRNIESLNNHTAFLFDKINFLMDATIGFININQNKRVSQLTILSVVIMPINILAGVGGMSEFSMMTAGIPWPIAYGGFVVGSGIIGYSTYLALKHLNKTNKAKSGR